MSDWVVALAHGRQWFGKVCEVRIREAGGEDRCLEGGRGLMPSYEMAANVSENPKTRAMEQQIGLMPSLGLLKPFIVPMPPGAVVVPFSDLTLDEQKVLSQTLAYMEELLPRMRARAGGVAIASALEVKKGH